VPERFPAVFGPNGDQPLDLSEHPRQILRQIERIARLAVHDDLKVGRPAI